MKIIIAPDSFKESLDSIEVAKAIKEGWTQSDAEAKYILVPISDGGEGIIDSLLAVHEGELCMVKISHPLYGSVQTLQARYAWLPRIATVVVEAAEAVGLDLVPQNVRNPMHISSYGLGEILLDIRLRFLATGKAHTIIVGVGGTASVDGGMGMAAALGAKFYDSEPHNIHKDSRTMAVKGGESLSRVRHIDIASMLSMTYANPSKEDNQYKDVKIIVAADVKNPLLGDRGACHVFAPQKGASAEMVKALEEGMHNYANIIAKDLALNLDWQIDMPSAGAGGGLGMALSVFCGATIQSGIDLMIEQLDLEAQLQDADLVITGEGKVDGQSLDGKVVSGILQVCVKHNVPVCIIGGALDYGYEALYKHGASAMFSATAISADWDAIQSNAYNNLVQVARSAGAMYALGKAHEKR